jgi:hypothetical protein
MSGPTRRPRHDPELEAAPVAIVEFGTLSRRLQTGGLVLAGLALLGCVADGVLRGLTFATIGRWAGIFAVALLLTSAVVVAVHALAGAGRAGRRGDRLSSPDVGIGPRRLGAVRAPGTDADADADAGADAEDR